MHVRKTIKYVWCHVKNYSYKCRAHFAFFARFSKNDIFTPKFFHNRILLSYMFYTRSTTILPHDRRHDSTAQSIIPNHAHDFETINWEENAYSSHISHKYVKFHDATNGKLHTAGPKQALLAYTVHVDAWFFEQIKRNQLRT